MTDQRSITDVLAQFFVARPGLEQCEIRVSEHVHRFLDRYAEAVDFRSAAAMTSMPIVIDDDLTGGHWQIREGGEVTSSGDMAPAPEGMTVFYTPHSGWLAIRKDLTQTPAAFGWTES